MAESDTDARRRRTRLITLTALGLVLVILAGVGIYGLTIGVPAPPATSSPPGPDDPVSTVSPTRPAGTLPSLPRTNDPQEFATAVAHALFTWDTFTLLRPRDHRDVLLTVADPTGVETPGLVADLDRYLPDQATWMKLQEYRTRQWLHLESIYVPEQWADAQAAGGGAIAEGTIAYTVEGTRHRAGVWHDDPVTSQHQVAFTIVLTCPPTAEQCALLRLSLLDQPLR